MSDHEDNLNRKKPDDSRESSSSPEQELPPPTPEKLFMKVSFGNIPATKPKGKKLFHKSMGNVSDRTLRSSARRETGGSSINLTGNTTSAATSSSKIAPAEKKMTSAHSNPNMHSASSNVPLTRKLSKSTANLPAGVKATSAAKTPKPANSSQEPEPMSFRKNDKERALAAKKLEEQDLKNKSDANHPLAAPVIPPNLRRSHRITSSSSSSNNGNTPVPPISPGIRYDSTEPFAKLQQLFGIQKDVDNDRVLLLPKLPKRDEKPPFKLPLYSTRHPTHADYFRESGLRTFTSAFQGHWFSEYLRRCELSRVQNDPSLLYCPLDVDESTGGVVVIRVPESVRSSRTDYDSILHPTRDQTEKVLQYYRKCSPFLQGVCRRAVEGLVAEECLRSSAEVEVSLFDELEQVVDHYTSLGHGLRLPNFSKMFDKLCDALIDAIRGKMPAPGVPNFNGDPNVGEKQKAVKNRTLFTQERLDEIPPSDHLSESQNRFWERFLGHPLGEIVLSSQGREFTVQDLLSFRMLTHLTQNVVNAMVRMVSRPSNTAVNNPSQNYYCFGLFETTAVMLEPEEFIGSTLAAINARRRSHQQWLDRYDARENLRDPNNTMGRGTEKTDVQNRQFRYFFPMHITLPDNHDHYVLVVATHTPGTSDGSKQNSAKQIQLYDPMKLEKDFVGDEETIHSREIRQGLRQVQTFMEIVTGEDWNMPQTWPSTQTNSVILGWRSLLVQQDSGIMMPLILDHLLTNNPDQFKTFHNIGLIQSGTMDAERFYYMNRIIDEYEASLPPDKRTFWKKPEDGANK